MLCTICLPAGVLFKIFLAEIQSLSEGGLSPPIRSTFFEAVCTKAYRRSDRPSLNVGSRGLARWEWMSPVARQD